MNESLRELLPPRLRLALAYAPRPVQGRWLALLALDQRLAATVRSAREPMLAQLRLAWWRERLSAEAAALPSGEPLLATLAAWGNDLPLLAPLVDGWEQLVEPPPLARDAFGQLAEARAGAMAAILPAHQVCSEARRMATDWSLADLAAHVSHPQERESLAAMAGEREWRPSRLPPALRPLAILHALSARDLRQGQGQDKVTPAGLLLAMRVGLFGR